MYGTVMTAPGGRTVAATVTALSLVAAVSILPAALAADAQPAGEVRQIGYLAGGSATVTPRTVEAFRQGLREFGWIEGRNIVIDYRFAEGRLDRLPDLAAELVRLKVEVIVAGPTPAAVAARKATATIPIVMWGVGDPVGLGLIANLARPGGNVTGVSFSVGAGTVGKGLELLKEIVPKVRRVAVLSNPANPSHAATIGDVKGAARSLGVQLQLLEAQSVAEFDGVFAAMAKERAGALLVVTDTVFLLHRARLADLTTKHRLPSMHGIAEYVEAGGLMSYGASGSYFLGRAASVVDKILKGAKPADLPVEQPTKFELVINLKTAKALGLTIPPSLLLRADQVIE
jgi:putative ABC transport system substrate-binding protein